MHYRLLAKVTFARSWGRGKGKRERDGIFLFPFTPASYPQSRVVSYKQRKTKTEFQSLSPRGREGKSHATFTRNQDLCIFIFSYETTLPPLIPRGGPTFPFPPLLQEVLSIHKGKKMTATISFDRVSDVYDALD